MSAGTSIMAIWEAALPQWMNMPWVATGQSGAKPPVRRRYMPGAPEIYFRKSIDNSRLVRATDPKVKREMRMFAITMAVCLVALLAYLGQHCRSIEYGYNIEALRLQCAHATEVNRTLKLEAATLQAPGRIDALATKMGLGLPAVGQVERMDAGSGNGAPVMARNEAVSVISVPN